MLSANPYDKLMKCRCIQKSLYYRPDLDGVLLLTSAYLT